MTRAALAALLLCAACGAVLPRPAAVNLLADGSQPLPARFVSRLILVSVSIDGSPAAPFLLDTGSDVSAVDWRLQERLQLPREGSAIARGSSGNVSTSIVRGRQLEAGPLQVRSPVFLLLDLSFLDWFAETRVGGILGLDVFQGLALTIDYAARVVELTQGRVSSTGGERIPLRKADNLYGIDVAIDRTEPVTLLIDTGMSGSVSLDADEARLRGFVGRTPREARWGTVGIAGTSRPPIATPRSLSLCCRELARPEVILEKPAGGFRGAIGGGVLRFFRFTLDLSTGSLLLHHGPSDRLDPRPENGTGFRFEWTRDGLRVLSVSTGSPADACGLQAGDLVTRVDGRPAASFGWRLLRSRLAAGSAPLTLTLATGDGEASVELVPSPATR
jgi:aspartyl protease/PDZ domain-containing protein